MKKPEVLRKPFFHGDDDITNIVHLTLLPRDLALYWQRCGLTADFGASFASFCFPEITKTRNSLSFILNELVENAVKYSSEMCRRIKITLFEKEGSLFFEVENHITKEQQEIFEQEIQALERCEDIEEFYAQAMERSMTGDDSHLGLVTILNDYNVGISFFFRNSKKKPSFRIVKIQVRINPKDII